MGGAAAIEALLRALVSLGWSGVKGFRDPLYGAKRALRGGRWG